jgi:hypothetical protein
MDAWDSVKVSSDSFLWFKAGCWDSDILFPCMYEKVRIIKREKSSTKHGIFNSIICYDINAAMSKVGNNTSFLLCVIGNDTVVVNSHDPGGATSAL